MNISLENVDPAWLLGILGGSQALGFFWLKKDTRQVNKAVNHVEPGTATLSERVDIVVSSLEYTQAQLIVHKKDTAQRFDMMEKSQHEIRGIVADVQDGVSKIRETVDRRKHDRKEKPNEQDQNS